MGSLGGPPSFSFPSKPLIHDHGANGGARGLFSVSAVKYTTARDVAEKKLGRASRRERV